MKTASNSTGLRYWMLRVVEECDNAAADFRPGPVHDLRVSLRRCRSLADGMMAMDPDRNWKAMKKAGRKLFRSLGALRDVQIMMEWIENLEFANVARTPSSALPGLPSNCEGNRAVVSLEHPSDAAADALLQILRERETEHKRQARTALQEFDRKQWRQWSTTLPQRAARIRPGSAVFRHLALERWTAARHLHTRAMRTRSQVALHTLRIGIKRFRYIVENFLPEEHKLWGKDLKHMQDLLGEVHDLDVLWATALESRIFPDDFSRRRWDERIAHERTKRIEEYRSRTSGPESLWSVWRGGLPHAREIQQIATRRIKLWARRLDPDFAHSELVAKLALELHDGLHETGLLGRSRLPASDTEPTDARESLYLAALLHDVGKAKGNKRHQKHSLELIESHGVPLGCKAETIRRAGLIARFHCGALPGRNHKHLQDLLNNERALVIRLVAILRLANALDAMHDAHVRRLRIENIKPAKRGNGFLRKPAHLAKNEALVIAAEGYADGTRTAQAVAAERYLLETVLKRPVIVRPTSGSRATTTGRRC